MLGGGDRPLPGHHTHHQGHQGCWGGDRGNFLGHLPLSKTLLLGQELDTHVQTCVPFGLSFLFYKMGILIVPPHWLEGAFGHWE